MSAAVYSSPCDRISDWLEELERTLTAIDGLPRAAQDAVKAVVESFAHDPETNQAEISHLNALLALHGMPHSDDGRHRRRTSLSQKRTQYAHRAALALSQSS